MRLTVGQLAERLGAELVGRPKEFDRQISAVGTVATAGESEVTFVTEERYLPALENSRAAAVIVGKRLEALAKPQLVVENVDAALIQTLSFFAPKLKPAVEGIDPTAKIGQDVKIAEGAAIGAWVVVDDEAQIGQGTVIGSGCKIGENSRVGKNCRFDSNVVVYHNCHIGDNVIIQANSTIGSIGFGYAFIDGAHKLIPHNGGVVIEDFVEIGANCCIDRAKFGNTIVGAGTKIDNLVQIAHNVVIGKCCLIAGQVGIAGSCKLGDGVVLGGQAGLKDNVEIGDGTMIGAQSGVIHSVPAGQQVVGRPAMEIREALRITGLTMRLPKLAAHLKELAKRVEQLEAAKDN
jgi:UDP-3-O-[3-hydroxymyristoyl] glucosamine N-acyltransferase